MPAAWKQQQQQEGGGGGGGGGGVVAAAARARWSTWGICATATASEPRLQLTTSLCSGTSPAACTAPFAARRVPVCEAFSSFFLNFK